MAEADITEKMPHDEKVARLVLSDIDEIAQQVGPTQGLPPGQKALTQAEEDAIWDDFDPEMAAQVPTLLAQGTPELLLATLVFPKRMKLIQRGRPSLTEQAKYAHMMAKRAEERAAGQEAEPVGDIAPPDPLDQPEPLPEAV